MRAKRGGGAAAVTLVTGAGENGGDPIEVLALDQALEQLAAQDPRKRDVLELHYFGGLSYAEMAHALGVSEATVDRDLRFAKAWVRQTLGG
jgi:RNA polymerase sigma factor (sigma-70 family)